MSTKVGLNLTKETGLVVLERVPYTVAELHVSKKKILFRFCVV